MLSGKIPSALATCVRLEHLSIRGNTFQGNIPASWSSLRGIQTLDVSSNNLSGTIPSFLGTFALQNVNLSFNNFEEEVPREEVFKNASAVFVNGNLKLCGGIPELKLPDCSFHRTIKKRASVNYKLVIPVVIGVLGLITLVLCLLIFLLKKRRRRRPSESRRRFTRVSYQDLNNIRVLLCQFNRYWCFVTVYREIFYGEMLKHEHHGASKSFIAECDA